MEGAGVLGHHAPRELTMVDHFSTARLSLHLVTEGDRDNLMALERDPEVMRFINGGQSTPADGRDDDAGFLMPRGGESGIWAAVEISTGKFVGWFSLRRSDTRRAELGYRLCRSAWGQGLASEGARALVKIGFTELALDRIVATTMAVNQASRRVMEKAGLSYVRTDYPAWPDPLPGSEFGEVYYEAVRGDHIRDSASAEAPRQALGP